MNHVFLRSSSQKKSNKIFRERIGKRRPFALVDKTPIALNGWMPTALKVNDAFKRAYCRPCPAIRRPSLIFPHRFWEGEMMLHVALCCCSTDRFPICRTKIYNLKNGFPLRFCWVDNRIGKKDDSWRENRRFLDFFQQLSVRSVDVIRISPNTYGKRKDKMRWTIK